MSQPTPKETKCLCCEHPVSAATPQALVDAIEAHAAYVNATKDRETDDHFEDMRLTALVLQ